MALALAMIAGGEKVATPANRAVGSISVYEGKYSYNPSYVWPQYMLMSNWCVPRPSSPLSLFLLECLD